MELQEQESKSGLYRVSFATINGEEQIYLKKVKHQTPQEIIAHNESEKEGLRKIRKESEKEEAEKKKGYGLVLKMYNLLFGEFDKQKINSQIEALHESVFKIVCYEQLEKSSFEDSLMEKFGIKDTGLPERICINVTKAVHNDLYSKMREDRYKTPYIILITSERLEAKRMFFNPYEDFLRLGRVDFFTCGRLEEMLRNESEQCSGN